MEKYRNKGLKLTPQRLAILEYLDSNQEHPSAESIYEETKKQYPTMSFATVYKTIETLKKRGDLLELVIDSGRRRYDPDTSPHHHFICTGCKKIIDVNADFSLAVPDELKGSFEITGSHITFYGRCKECNAKGGSGDGFI
jgi:Fur family peroxide stress response transcriptional regulator